MDSAAVLTIVGLGCTSITSICIAVWAKSNADAAIDLARGTSERCQGLARMLRDMNDMVEELDKGLCKEIDRVKATAREAERIARGDDD